MSRKKYSRLGLVALFAAFFAVLTTVSRARTSGP